MENNQNKQAESAKQSGTPNEENKDQQPMTVHNPLNPNSDKQITQEDVENEQKFKEAMTERD